MKYIIANWKLNMDAGKISEWTRIWNGLEKRSNNIPIVAASHPHLHLLSSIKDIKKCAQDISCYETGAHTGEVSAIQVAEFCEYCIIGHSERNENIQIVQQKIAICLKHGIKPIVCFSDPNNATVFEQKDIILAWEDPDNISQNGEFRPKNPEDINLNFQMMRRKLENDTVLLYGGSVNRDNVVTLKTIEGLNGVLVGGASVDAQHFYEILENL